MSEKFHKRFPDVQLLNDYSISECHDVCTLNISQERGLPLDQYASLGKPMSNVSVYVLDDQKRPVPRGCEGEVFVAGDSLAIGYLNQPEKTRARFVKDTVSGKGRMFQTGDSGRIKLGGDLEIMGRLQFMIKIRGYTVVPDAVSAAMKEFPGVTGALVHAELNDDTGQPDFLVGYLILEEGLKQDIIPKLRKHLRGVIPAYAIPSHFEIIEALPISEVTGKTDLKLLPKKELRFKQEERTQIDSEIEGKLLKIFSEVLGREVTDAEENFFDAGGHSLLAIQLAEMIKTKLNSNVQIVDIFENGTAKKLAELLGEKPAKPEENDSLRSSRGEGKRGKDIAIVGAACKFPGVNGMAEFWELLSKGGCSIKSFTEEELARNGVPSELFKDPSYINAGAVLDDPYQFDPEFWGISRREAEIMDPQQRVFLQCAWEAMENAGYAKLATGVKTGIFAGSYLPSYLLGHLNGSGLLHPTDPTSYHLTEIGNDKDYLTTRASYLLNCTGPSLAIQTSCSTSLVAVATAAQFLQTGQCDMAIAGASSITFPQGGYQFQEGHVLSPDGMCRAFDQHANGTILGDGVGVLILKRLEEALESKDNILAVIKGFAINNDGQAKNGFSSPSTKGQVEVIKEAMKSAGINPRDVSYIEGHGTGTVIGDAIEVSALSKAFGTTERQFCGLGSVKPNIGHSNIAAGMAGICKTILALQHKLIPPTINFVSPNKSFNLESSPFYIVHKLTPWEGEKKVAGISSFGIGGTNCHLVLAEAPKGKIEPEKEAKAEMITVSAKSEVSIKQMIEKLAEYLTSPNPRHISELAFTLHSGREDFYQFRAAVAASDPKTAAQKLLGKLQAPVSSSNREGNSKTKESRKKVVFMFPGQGSQYPEMGSQLYNLEPVFAKHFDKCCSLFLEKQGLDIKKLVFDSTDKNAEDVKTLDQVVHSQPAIFSIEFALAQTLIEWGIAPAVVVGHSIGEYAAATVAGILDLNDAVELVGARSQLMEAAPHGRMLAVNCEKEILESFLSAKKNLWLSVENSSRNFVVSGTESAIKEATAILKHRDFQAKLVRGNIASHCPLMAGAATKLEQLASKIKFKTPNIGVLTNVSGTWLKEETMDQLYWAKQLTHKTQFSSNIKALLDAEPDVLLEVGPSRVLKTLASKIANDEGQNVAIFSSLPHPKEEKKSHDMLMETLASMWELGVDVDWEAFHWGRNLGRVPLPGYQFDNKVCFPEKLPGAAVLQNKRQSSKLSVQDRFFMPAWTKVPRPPLKDNGHCDNWVIIGSLSEKEGVFPRRVESSLVSSGKTVTTTTIELLPERLGQNTSLITFCDFEPSVPCTPEESLGYFQALLSIVKTLSKDTSGGTLWLISQGMVQVDQEDIEPGLAPLISLLVVLSQEAPEWKTRVLDLPWDADEATYSRQIHRELNSEIADSFAMVALRGRSRWAPRFDPLRLPNSALDEPNFQLKPDGVYLISGGLGRIGKALADHVNKLGATVVVTTRSKSNLRSKGEIVVEEADFGVREEVDALLERVVSTYGRLDGIFHAAGVADLKYLGSLDPATVEAEFRPKVFGTSYLKQALQSLSASQKPDFVVLFSSMAAILGGYGMAAYAGANAFLDSFATAQPHEERPVWVSANWDDWDFHYGKEQTEAFQRSSQKSLAMSVEEGIDALQRVLAVASDYPQEVLGVSALKANDNFFDLGGDSLLAAQLLLRLRRSQRLQGGHVSLQDIFLRPSVIELAKLFGDSN